MKYIDQAITLILVALAGSVVFATILPVLMKTAVVIAVCVVMVRGVSYWLDRR